MSFSCGEESLRADDDQSLGDESTECHSSDIAVDDDKQVDSTNAGRNKSGGSTQLERLRREKRLAMNRESARARRKKKKFMFESLKARLDEVNTRNQTLRLSNGSLRAQVAELQSELSVAKSTIQTLVARNTQSLPPSLVSTNLLREPGKPSLPGLLQGDGIQSPSALGSAQTFTEDNATLRYLRILAQAKNREAIVQGSGAGLPGGTKSDDEHHNSLLVKSALSVGKPSISSLRESFRTFPSSTVPQLGSCSDNRVRLLNEYLMKR